MLNEDLMDAKDIEIFKLKKTIEKFKEYDEERKAYYRDLVLRVKELESLVEELKSQITKYEQETKIGVLQKRLKNQRIALSRLAKIDNLNKYSEAELLEIDALGKTIDFKLINDRLRKRLKAEKDAKDKLLSLIAKYRDKYGGL
ncbi:MAG: hypothetical protein IKU16_01105 [Muribaculaceae bacterium]|nr:hypothetical protein [Muribaculaceae bacterium]